MKNFQKLLKGRVAIGVDTSASMYNSMGNSALQYADLACYYGAYLAEICDGDLFFWSDNCKKIDYQNVDITDLKRQGFRWGTNLSSFLNMAHGYDTLFVITDEQIRGNISNPTGNKIIWNIQDYQHSITTLYGWDYITGLDDRML